MNYYELVLPLAPSINHYYGTSGNRRYIKEAGVTFRAEVARLVKQSGMPTLDGRLCVVIRAYFPDKRKRDVDNVAKAALDALQHAGAYLNDCQIDDLQIKRDKIVPGGRLEILIGEIACQS
jgi:crossover junction endodeoxyribonuclease RusA